MAGIYIHIPFCRKSCAYCDFHFSTSLKRKDEFLAALSEEIDLQKDYLEGETVNTIYFGGGTPSLLSAGEASAVLEQIYDLHDVDPGAEISLEANPDDLKEEKIKAFAGTAINRLSIGVQSFFDEDLQYMTRIHNASEAHRAIELAKQEGFGNLTVDLIYGTPTMHNDRWLKNLEYLRQYEVPHLSAYALTVENHTPLEAMITRDKRDPVSEGQASEQFNLLLDWSAAHDYEQYEISNFARAGKYSRHNSSYWLQEKYLGLGPSAHSFNGRSRQWNVPHNLKYIRSLEQGELLFEKEELSAASRYNEYILTGLRTKWGIDAGRIKAMHGKGMEEYFLEQVGEAVKEGMVKRENDTFTLSDEGKLFADAISADLFAEQEKEQ